MNTYLPNPRVLVHHTACTHWVRDSIERPRDSSSQVFHVHRHPVERTCPMTTQLIFRLSKNTPFPLSSTVDGHRQGPGTVFLLLHLSLLQYLVPFWAHGEWFKDFLSWFKIASMRLNLILNKPRQLINDELTAPYPHTHLPKVWHASGCAERLQKTNASVLIQTWASDKRQSGPQKVWRDERSWI